MVILSVSLEKWTSFQPHFLSISPFVNFCILFLKFPLLSCVSRPSSFRLMGVNVDAFSVVVHNIVVAVNRLDIFIINMEFSYS